MKNLIAIKRIYTWVSSFFIHQIAIRHDNPFATHLPVLIGLARIMKIRRILELGSGELSTPTFLDRTYFPDLEHLVSFEDNPEWAQRLSERLNPDGRFELMEVDVPISSIIKKIESNGFDLIFVDNAMSIAERANTIAHLSIGMQKGPVVLIHDYELISYQEASATFAKRFSFMAFNPATGLVWNGNSINRLKLYILDGTLKWYASDVLPDNIARWKFIFEKTWFL